MTVRNKRASSTEQARSPANTGSAPERVVFPYRRLDLPAAHYRHVSKKEERAFVARHHPGEREPFRVFLPDGATRFRMTFCVSGVRYEGSTLCEERALAVQVARAVYAEIKETAGRLLPDDPRRQERIFGYVLGHWLTSRPKRLPSIPTKAATIPH